MKALKHWWHEANQQGEIKNADKISRRLEIAGIVLVIILLFCVTRISYWTITGSLKNIIHYKN